MTSASRTRSPSSQASLFGDEPSDRLAAPQAPLPQSMRPIQSTQSTQATPPPSLEAQFDALPPAWRAHLRPFTDSDAYAPLCRFVDGERAAGKTVYPADVFRALRLTSPDEVKVVILGQDPYHGEDRGTPRRMDWRFPCRRRYGRRRRCATSSRRSPPVSATSRRLTVASMPGRNKACCC